MADLFVDSPQPRIVAIYDYRDESGQLLFQVVRFEPKSFAQRRPDGRGGFVWDLDGVRRVPYRLPQLLNTVGTVYVPEGEKDADRVADLGLTATCNPCGAGNWRDEFNQHFAGRDVVILPDNDGAGLERAERFARVVFPVGKSVRVVWLAGLPPKGDVSDWLDAGHTVAELEEVVAQTPLYSPGEAESAPVAESLSPQPDPAPAVEDGPEWSAPLDPGPYLIDRGRICIERVKEHGPVRTALCNFAARVSEEIILDDGAEATRAFLLDGELCTGERLPQVRVPAARFSGMTWVADLWGFSAIVNAGLSTQDQLREAIQRLSPVPRLRRVFTHTGWRELDSEWFYLTAGGAVGRDGCEVDLGPELARFSLPRTPENEVEAMRLSLKLLDLAPLTVTAPLFAAIYRAPLASAWPLDFSLWIEGPTGSLKSTIASVFESHFGHFSETALPGAWSSTANQLERRAFILKDAPFVIDDYAPSGMDARELETKASRLLRSQGNLSGRGRLRADLSERPAYPPRGIIIGTGEQHPPGQSLLARTLLVELDRTQVNLSALTEAQRTAARLPHAMAGYLLWLAPQMGGLPKILREAFEGARHRATAGSEHLRVPGALAHLWIGLDCGLRYAVEVGAIPGAEAEGLKARCWDALWELGDRQAQSVEGERPSWRFLTVFGALLAQGRTILLNKDSRSDTYNGNAAMVGWQDEEFIYLIPEAAYRAVIQFCRESGEPFPVRSVRLLRDLEKEGLSDCSEGRHTATVTLGGQKRRVVKIWRERAEALLGEALPGPAAGTAGAARTAPGG